MLIGETNAGYEIIAAIPVEGRDDREFIVTAKDASPLISSESRRYATWRAHLEAHAVTGGTLYEAGHYDMPRGEALRDMIERAGLVVS